MHKRKRKNEKVEFGEKSSRTPFKPRSPKMLSKTTSLSADTARSVLEAHLRAMGEIPDNYTVKKFKFVPEALNNETLIPIQWEAIKDKEVRISRNNG